jgi:hypothetical protein
MKHKNAIRFEQSCMVFVTLSIQIHNQIKHYRSFDEISQKGSKFFEERKQQHLQFTEIKSDRI